MLNTRGCAGTLICLLLICSGVLPGGAGFEGHSLARPEASSFRHRPSLSEATNKPGLGETVNAARPAPVSTSLVSVSAFARAYEWGAAPPRVATTAEPSTVIFADDFDAETGQPGELDYFGFINWNVTSGSVDLIGNGAYDFFPGNGFYVDLDGTSFQAGTLESKTTFTLVPATYRLEFSLAGSQRGDSNTVVVRLGGVFSEAFTLDAGVPFTTISRDIVVASRTRGKIVFEHSGNDNIGLLLDNVRLLTDITEPRLFDISPDRGGNAGSVTANIQGLNFPHGPATVRLSAHGGPDVIGSAAAGSPTSLTTTFDLVGAAPGLRDLVVTFSDGNTLTLPNAFTVEEGGDSRLWVDVLGRDFVRSGQATTYQVVFGNSGNVNWDGLAFFALSVPVGVEQVTVKYTGVTVGEFAPLPAPAAPGFAAANAAALTSSPVGLFNLPLLAPSQQGSYSITIKTTQPGDLGVQLFQIPAPPGGGPSRNTLGEAVNTLFDRKFSELGIDIPEPPEGFQKAVIAASQATILKALQEFTPKPEPFDDLFVANTSPHSTMVVQARRRALEQLEREWSQFVEEQENALDQLEQPQNWGVFNSILRDNWGAMGSPVELSPETTKPIQIVRAIDPNDKVGSRGAGDARYLSGGEPLRYAVYFENIPTATAPARDVVISDQLDATMLDLSTFRLGPITFGDVQVIPQPGLSDFSTEVDLRPGKNLIVKIDARLDTGTGLLTCSLTSIDPGTGLPPEDPLAGFLPPNRTAPEGEGSLVFTVMPKGGLATGTRIQNRAAIVFDENEAVHTPEWFNTLDNTKPLSQVLPLGVNQCAEFQVSWSGADAGSGVQDYSVYVSENGGRFAVWLSNTAATSGTFRGLAGKSYAFYSVARDRTGNVEDAPSVADAAATVNDTQAPVISGVTVDKPSLRPPNHQMVDVTVSYNVADDCDPSPRPACTLSVASDEPVNGTGDGDTAPDWEVVSAHHVRLRAERAGVGAGRTYTVHITCADGSGNSSSKTVTIGVPKK
jgi:hypothetical protein